MAEKAVKNNEFHEIYHPDTGLPYGGLQEFDNTRIGEWGSCTHQTWSATGYISMVLYCILGAKVSEGKVEFAPYLPEGLSTFTVSGLNIGEAEFDITVVKGEGESKAVCDTLNKGKVTLTLNV